MSEGLIYGWIFTCMLAPCLTFAQTQPQESLPLKTDEVTWTDSGFRLQLNIVDGELIGLDGAPDGETIGVEVVAGARLDLDWSLLGSLRYTPVSSNSPVSSNLSGLRFSALIEPTYHLWRGLTLGVGLGTAGILERDSSRPDPDPEQASTLVASYTYPNSVQPLAQCNGFGSLAAARLGYWYDLSNITSIGVSVRFDYQHILCEHSTNRVEPDSAEPIVRRQWWSHFAWSLTGGFSWR